MKAYRLGGWLLASVLLFWAPFIGFPFGIAPLVPPGDDWWPPMSDADAEGWIEGK